MKNTVMEETEFQDKNAESYSCKRESDLIWEVPEEMFLIKKKYFGKGSIVVDMGCGPAISVRNIISEDILRNCNYIGVDISKNMLKYAKQNVPYGKFIYGNIEELDFDKDYADVILSLGALHHCKDKLETIRKWLRILKSRGLILLREPTYEAMPKGKGESPLEEGVKVKELLDFLKKQKVEIVSLNFFSSSVFHLCNRIMIKLGLSRWQKVKLFWYPVVLTDVILDKLISSKIKFFKGCAFALIIRKL